LEKTEGRKGKREGGREELVSERPEADRCHTEEGGGRGSRGHGKGWSEARDTRSQAALGLPPSPCLHPSLDRHVHTMHTPTYLPIFVAADPADLAKGALPNHLQDVVFLLGGGHGSCGRGRGGCSG